MTDHHNKDFLYKKSTHWKEDNEEKVGYEVVCEDLILTRNRRNKDLSINFKCKEARFGCKASITISSAEKIVYFVDHNFEMAWCS